MDQQFDPKTGFLGLNNQLGNLTINPVYVVTKVVQLLPWVEDAILGTRVQSDCRRACYCASDGKCINKEYYYEINFAGATSVNYVKWRNFKPVRFKSPFSCSYGVCRLRGVIQVGKTKYKFAGYHVSTAQSSAWVSYWLLCFQQVHVVGVCVFVARKREGSLVLGEERVKCERYTARVNTTQCRCAPKIWGRGVAGWLTL